MWFDEDKAYKSGTFKLGQEVYSTKDITHRFRFHKECNYCDNTGKVLIKGKEFTCPNCNAETITKEVIERAVGDSTKIRSIIAFKNRNKSVEIYTTDSSGYGWIIQKQDDGSNRFFGSIEEAEDNCKKYNALNGIQHLIEDYSNRKDRIFE